MRFRTLLNTAAVALWASIGCIAPAQAAELSLAQPAACTTEDELSYRVERLLGQRLASAPASRFLIHIQPASAGFAARLEVSSTEPFRVMGTRSLAARECEELTQALAIAIALSIGASSPSDTSPLIAPAASPAEPDAVGPSRPPEPISSDDVVRAPPGPAAAGASFAALAWALGDTGSLPSAGVGVAIGAELDWYGFGLRALGTLIPARPRRVDATSPASPGAEIGLMAASFVGCVPLTRGGPLLDLTACGGWELGQLAGHGTGVAEPHQNSTWWSAARIDLGARWLPWGRPLGFELLASVLAPLTRDEFILKDIGSVYRPANLVGRAGLGVSLSID
jgi:hypothetical protein